MASGNSDDSTKNFKNSAEPEGSGEPGTICVSIFKIYFHNTMFRALFGDVSPNDLHAVSNKSVTKCPPHTLTMSTTLLEEEVPQKVPLTLTLKKIKLIVT